MSSATIPLISRRSFDFSNIGINGSVYTQLVKAIDVSQYTSGTLGVRIHSKNIVAGGSISVMAYMTAPTPEEPNVDFIDFTSAVATVAVDNSGTAPALELASLSSGFGGMLTIFVQGDQPTAPGTIEAELSAFIVLKS